jgi:hypothetical protein
LSLVAKLCEQNCNKYSNEKFHFLSLNLKPMVKVCTGILLVGMEC